MLSRKLEEYHLSFHINMLTLSMKIFKTKANLQRDSAELCNIGPPENWHIKVRMKDIANFPSLNCNYSGI